MLHYEKNIRRIFNASTTQRKTIFLPWENHNRGTRLSIVGLASKLRDIICADINKRGVVGDLCEAVTSKYGVNPLLLVCETLADIIQSRRADVIFISFGFATPPKYVQETDGVTGAVFLARALKRLGVATALIIDERTDLIRVTGESLRAAGLKPAFTGGCSLSVRSLRNAWIPVLTLRTAYPLTRGDLTEIFSDLPPSAIVFVEKAGHNYLGVYHSMKGIDVSQHHSHVEEVMNVARTYDAITISVGDGGNEVGMGVIEDTVRRVVPYGNACRCPCRGGIAASSTVDYLVTSVISNVGAYAMELLLLKLLGKLNYAHSVSDEILCLKSAVSSGAVDGVTGAPKVMVDGLPRSAYEELLYRVLNAVV